MNSITNSGEWWDTDVEDVSDEILENFDWTDNAYSDESDKPDEEV